jgi:para-nitrobenzyl esterase
VTRRRRALLGALGALALCATAACGSNVKRNGDDGDALVVRTETGAVAGQEAAGVRHWLGIPYAAPPVGDLRWRAPEPAAEWSGTRKAEAFGPPCLQAGETQLNPDSAEDCLYLNVHRPAGDGEDLPVMVWIHGGALKTGSGTLPVEMAKGLVDQGVVLVSINYRLGRLGYFAHPALEAEAEADGGRPVANFGLLDQVAALEWVRDNIDGFGGDPDRVTIFGISAGGASVNYLMSSPEADGLFDRAVSQSGLGREQPRAWADAVAQGESLAASIGAPEADAETLRGLDAEEVARLPALMLRNEIPIIDRALPRSVADTFEAGEEADVPYIVGATDLEMIPAFFVPLGIDADLLGQELVEGRQAEALAAYDGSLEEFRRHFANDVIFGEPARNLALAHGERAPTYFYRFSIVDERTRRQHGGALHGADYPFIFGFGPGAPEVENADHLAAEVSRCWAGFAKGEVPECGGAEWPEVGDGELMDFTNDGPEVMSDDPWGDRLDLVEDIVTGLT